MPEAVKKTIARVTPRHRCQEEILFSDGSREVRCYSPANPHYYKDGDGVLTPINMGAVEGKGSGVGAAKLRSQNVVSAGVRADGNLSKVVGLRPDFSQAKGDHQLEFTLVSVVVDGVDRDIASKVKQPSASAKKDHAWDMGRYQVIQNRRYCRQAVMIDRPKASFRIEFLIHAKGLVISPVEAKGRSCWHVRDDSGEVDWMIAEPLLLDDNLDILTDRDGMPVHGKYVTHAMVDNNDGTFTYTKVSVPGADFSSLPSQIWVDVSTVYCGTADGYIYGVPSSWATARNAASGGVLDTSGTKISVKASATPSYYSVFRGFLYFTVSGLAGNVSGCSLYLSIYSYANAAQLCVQEGTQGTTLSLDDYDAFTGSVLGVMPAAYSYGYKELILNAYGVSYVESEIGSGIVKLCVREQNHDVNNSAPPASSAYGHDFYAADMSGSSYDPYLSISLNPTITTSTGIDGLLETPGDASAGLDGLLGDFSGAANAGLSAMLESYGGIVSSGLDGVVGINFTATSMKANLVYLVDESVGMDGVIWRQPIVETGLSACLTRDMGVTAGIGGLLRETFTQPIDMDVLAQALVRASAGHDACVQSDSGNFGTNLHGFLQTSGACASVIDACPSIGTTAVPVGLDAAVLDVVEMGVEMDAIAVWEVTPAVGVDAVTVTGTQAIAGISGCIEISVTNGVLADSLLMEGFTSASSIDAVAMGAYVSASDVDWILVVEESATTGFDGAIQDTSAAAIVFSGCLETAFSADMEADACLSVTHGVVSGMDVVVSADIPVAGNIDACVKGGADASIVLDGLLMVHGDANAGLDAQPFFGMAQRCGVDGCQKVDAARSFSLDAQLSSSHHSDLLHDGLVMTQNIEGEVSMSSCLEGQGFSSALMDAVLASITASRTEFSAWVSSESHNPVSLDAVLAGRRVPPGASANEIIYAGPRTKSVRSELRTAVVHAPIRLKTIYYQS